MNVLMVPEAAEMEKALLVGLLSDPSLIPRISTEVDEGDFFRQPHKDIYRVIKELDTNLVDSLTVQEKLVGETKEYFIELVKSSDSLLPSLTNMKVYAETIKEKAKLRQGINLGREISALCYESNIPAGEALQRLEDMFSKFLQGRVLADRGQTTKSAFVDFVEELPYTKAEVGLNTGFEAVDQMIALEGMVVLAARPSLGKTSLATQIMRNVAETRPVLFFSLEQPRKQIFQRMLASESQVNLSDIKTSSYQDDKNSSEKVGIASKRLELLMNNIHIDDMGAVNSSYITSVSRQKKFEWGDLGLIIVDYLHIMTLKEGNKVDTLGDAVKELRALGKELNAPVLLLSQLSRQNETFVDKENGKRNRRPELTDLRSSGEIEQSADVVMFLWREKDFDTFSTPATDFVEVLVRKNRNGPIGMNNLKWIPRFVRFEDI